MTGLFDEMFNEAKINKEYIILQITLYFNTK